MINVKRQENISDISGREELHSKNESIIFKCVCMLITED